MSRSTSVMVLALAVLPLNLAVAKPKTTVAQPSAEARILKAIDNICGDTWCEGDYRYTFSEVLLDSKANQTQVSFTMSPWLDETVVADEATFSAATLAPEYKVKCVVKGFSDATLILEANGSLNWDFYTAMSDCVNALEKSFVK